MNPNRPLSGDGAANRRASLVGGRSPVGSRGASRSRVGSVERVGAGHGIGAAMPPTMPRLGRTITRWASQITAWHRSHHTHGPTEAINDVAKRIKRVTFRPVNLRHHRVCSLLLHADNPTGHGSQRSILRRGEPGNQRPGSVSSPWAA